MNASHRMYISRSFSSSTNSNPKLKYRMLIYVSTCVVALLIGICSARDAGWRSDVAVQKSGLVKATKSNATFVDVAMELGMQEAT